MPAFSTRPTRSSHSSAWAADTPYSAANVLRAVVELLPGGVLITRALDTYGLFYKVGAWVDQQIRTLGLTGSLIRQAIDRFLKAANKAFDYFNQQRIPGAGGDYIFVKADNRLEKIAFADILFTEALENYVAIYTREKKIITHLTLKTIPLLFQFPVELFIRLILCLLAAPNH